MMHRLIGLAFSAVLFWLAPSTNAQTKLNYFSAGVPVKTQNSSERASAARNALRQVLVRMSGSEHVLDDSLVLQKSKNALSLVEQYQYAALESEVLKEEGYEEMLSFTFSSSMVRKILTDSQKPFWSVNRPTTLIWLVEDTAEAGRQLLNQQSESFIIQSLADAADRRGLPVMFPLLDLDDQLALSADDVWNVNESVILDASQRYDADVILVGRYSQTSRGELWTIWQFFHAGMSQSYDGRFVLEDEKADGLVGINALDPLADFLAQRYAISPRLEATGRLVMQVSGITNFGSYRQSLDYLEGLAAISDIQLAAVRQDTVLVVFESEASIDKLLSAFALDGKLYPRSNASPAVPVWQQVPQGTMENPLRFEWSL